MTKTPSGPTKTELSRQRLRALAASASDLIDELDSLHPDRFPDISLSDREVWAAAGEVRLVRLLKQLRSESRATDNLLRL